MGQGCTASLGMKVFVWAPPGAARTLQQLDCCCDVLLEKRYTCDTAVELGTGCSWLITFRIQWTALIKMVMNLRFPESGDLFHLSHFEEISPSWKVWSPYSSVGVVIVLWAGRIFRFSEMARDFSLLRNVQTYPATHIGS